MKQMYYIQVLQVVPWDILKKKKKKVIPRDSPTINMHKHKEYGVFQEKMKLHTNIHISFNKSENRIDNMVKIENYVAPQVIDTDT